MTCHGRVHVVYTSFLLHDVHQFKSLRLLNMSNHLSCDRQYVVDLLELLVERFNNIVNLLELIEERFKFKLL
jgi:hypothetical protein